MMRISIATKKITLNINETVLFVWSAFRSGSRCVILLLLTSLRASSSVFINRRLALNIPLNCSGTKLKSLKSSYSPIVICCRSISSEGGGAMVRWW